MANYSKRVSVYSSTGSPPTLVLSEEDVGRLAGIYGVKISPEAKDQLIAIADDYLRWRVAELESDTLADVRRMFSAVKTAVAGFQRFAYGEIVGMSDAGTELSGILQDHIAANPARILERNLLMLGANDREWRSADAGDSALAIKLDSNVLMQVGISLGVAIKKTENELAEREADEARQGFTPGGAFREWLIRMRQWAKAHGLRYGPYSATGEASRFSCFLHQLNKLFDTHTSTGESDGTPVRLSDPVNSAEALADRLKRVNRAAPRSIGGNTAED